MKSAPALSLPPSPAPPPLYSVSGFCLSVRGRPIVPCGRRGRGNPAGAPDLQTRPSTKNVPVLRRPSMHLSLPEHSRQKSLKEGLKAKGADGRASGGGEAEEDREGAWSDAGGWLCGGLLFAVPQASRLLFVAHTHLLRDVHQRTGHCQTRLSWRRDAAGASG